MPGLGREDAALLLVDLVVGIPLERAGDGGEAVVQLGGVGDATGDDQRGPGLVDEDGVDLVDDGVHVAPLHLVQGGGRHVVPQVVEADLVVRAVRDVAAVVEPLLGRRLPESGDHQADLEAHPPVDLTHPLRVAPGQVVVDRDQVDALAREAVEVGRQGRHQGLALTGLHLGDPAEVEGRAAHQLHVEVALADDPVGRLPHGREGVDEEVVQLLAVLQPLAELGGLGLQLVVREGLHLGLDGVDVGHEAGERLDLLAFTGAEDAIEDAHAGSDATGEPLGGAASACSR